jgi:adenylate kinase family enzyme
MNRAKILLEKLVAAHIEGSPGAGKTHLMNQLEKEFPEFMFADLDWFRNAAINDAEEIEGELSREQLYKRLVYLDRLSQKYLDKWLKKQTKPVVLFGWGVNFIMEVVDPSGKVLLSTSPLKSAYRNYKRQRDWEKETGYPSGSITDKAKKFIRDVLDNVRYKKYTKNKLGYKSVNPKKVKARLKEISQRLANE